MGGPGSGRSGQQQHVDPHRKSTIRADLLRFALSGPAYVPFIGDGDLAAELYQGRHIDGADIDPVRVATAAARLPDAAILQADCDGPFPFADRPGDAAPYAVADFDAYAYPWDAFRAFWATAPRAERLIAFFTDSERRDVKRGRHWHEPSGRSRDLTGPQARNVYNFYWATYIYPWLAEHVRPWTVERTTFYLRGDVLYFGAVIDAPNKAGAGLPPAPFTRAAKFNPKRQEEYLQLIADGQSRASAAAALEITGRSVDNHISSNPKFAAALHEAERERTGKVENALWTAAASGNVMAMLAYLYNREPDRWQDKRNMGLTVGGNADAPPVRMEIASELARVDPLTAALSARLAARLSDLYAGGGSPIVDVSPAESSGLRDAHEPPALESGGTP